MILSIRKGRPLHSAGGTVLGISSTVPAERVRTNETALPRQVLARYGNIRPLASGGMGQVYAAVDRVLGRPVALKVIRPEGAADRKRRKRLAREVLAMANVAHTNLVHCYDFCDDDTPAFYVMELVPGRTLEALTEDGPLQPTTAVALTAQIADALAALHEAGILHRDVTPANVMVRPDGVAKLMDFGLVKLTERDDLTELTDKDGLLGTLLYLPPEYLRHQPWTKRSDVYQAGAVLYRLLTGRVPVTAERLLSYRHESTDAPVAPPSTLLGKAYVTLDDLVARALAPSPTDRFASAAELRDACLAWLVARDAAPVRPLPSPEKLDAPSRHDVPTLVRLQVARCDEERATLRRWRLVLAAVTAVLVAATLTSSLVRLATVGEVSPRPVAPQTLHSAVMLGDTTVCRTLLAQGADMHGLDDEGWTPLHTATLTERADMARQLVERGCPVDVVDSRGFTPLQWASFLTSPELVTLFLEKGADPNAGRGRCTPLNAALGSRRAEMLAVLGGRWTALARRVRTDAVTDGRAVRRRCRDVALALVAAGADGSVTDDIGATALHRAAAQGLDAVVVALLARGVANIDAVDGHHETALHQAVRSPTPDLVVHTLLAAGASTVIRNSDGRTAADVAALDGRTTLATLVRRD